MNKQTPIKIIFLLLFCLLVTAFGNTAMAQFPGPPILDCLTEQPNGNVLVNWTPQNTCGATFTSYNIYVSEVETGPYTLAGTVNDFATLEFEDPFASTTSNTLYYYVEEQCQTAVSPPSLVVSTEFPEAPFLQNVTVLDDNSVQLTWTHSTSPEAHGYIIYRADDSNNFIPIDTVLVSDGNNYTDITALPAEDSEAYKIASFDECGEPEPGPDNGIIHRTVYLTYETDACTRQVTFNWTAYDGWLNGVEEYELRASVAGGAPQTITTFTPSESSYTHDFTGTEPTCFRIVAKQTGSATTSLSNKVCIDIADDDSPDYICLDFLSIQDGRVRVEWNTTLGATITELNLWRSSGSADDLEYLGTLQPDAPPIFLDDNVQASYSAYYYQLQHLNDCEVEVRSNIGRTILLQGENRFNFSNELSWSPFELEGANILSYTLYRSENDNTNFNAIATFTPDEELLYVDALSSEVIRYCYRVEAKYDFTCDGNGSTENGFSFSNEVCIDQAARIFVPNAFVPEGVNNVFKPVILFPNSDAYTMVILNRWGAKVFETTDPDAGWDGMYNGKLAPQGVYVYVIKMQSERGIMLEREGSLMLIR